jgi:hypothetical protein
MRTTTTPKLKGHYSGKVWDTPLVLDYAEATKLGVMVGVVRNSVILGEHREHG